MISLLFIILVVSQIDGNGHTKNSPTENTRPIIGNLRNLVEDDYRFNLGILTQPTPSNWQKPNRTTYLAASYVKYVESTGAQVVPIR